MANQLSGNPWVIDTAGATSVVATGTSLAVRAVRWVGATTNAHEAIIQDAAGLVKWAGKAATATLGITDESHVPFTLDGFNVPTLGSGKLYVYF